MLCFLLFVSLCVCVFLGLAQPIKQKKKLPTLYFFVCFSCFILYCFLCMLKRNVYIFFHFVFIFFVTVFKKTVIETNPHTHKKKQNISCDSFFIFWKIHTKSLHIKLGPISVKCHLFFFLNFVVLLLLFFLTMSCISHIRNYNYKQKKTHKKTKK